MRIAILLLSLLLCPIASAQTASLRIVADRPDAIYHAGDPVTFTVEALEDGQPVVGAELTCTLERNGEPASPPVTFTTTAEPRTFKLIANGPGFVRCTVTWPGRKDARNRDLKVTASAAVDPLQIKPGQAEPGDFDAFWAGKTAELEETPLEITLTPATDNLPGDVAMYDLEVNCTGPMPVRGYYVIPTNATKGDHPALLSVHGAGVRSSQYNAVVQYAAAGYIALDINAHGLPNGQPDAYYTDLSRGELADYRERGWTDRESVYFLGMYQRVYRGLQFLKSQPEWNGRVLVVKGSSQGGGQALVGGGLDPDVTLVIANIPALCDHGGELVGRRSGWPAILSKTKRAIEAGDAPAGSYEQVLNTMGYFDAAHFASRIKGRAILATGFRDTTCPPESVYAAYNNIPGEKRIILNLHEAHTQSAEAKRVYDEAVLSLVEPAPAAVR